MGWDDPAGTWDPATGPNGVSGPCCPRPLRTYHRRVGVRGRVPLGWGEADEECAVRNHGGTGMTVAQGGVGVDPGRLVGTGELHAADVSRIYEQAMAAAWAGGQTVVLDLTQVTRWSVVAQAMIVGVARDLAKQRSRLVLTGGSLRLRLQSQQIDVFNKVRELSA